MTNPFGFLEKFANPTDAQMWENLKSLGLAGLGVGAAGRGALGLYRSIKGSPEPWQHPYPQALVTHIPIPVDDPQEEKMAGSSSLPTGWEGVGYGAKAVGALGLGAYGGWKGMDYLLNQHQQAQGDAELNQAKQEYEDALRDSYVGARKTTAGLQAGVDTIKSAGAQLGEALDTCYDQLEKQGDGIWDTLGKIKEYGAQVAHDIPAGYGAYAAMTAAPAAMWAYGAVDRSGRWAALEKAIQIRNRQQYTASPPQIYAIPQPVKAPTRINPEDEADASSKELGRQGRTPSMAF